MTDDYYEEDEYEERPGKKGRIYILRTPKRPLYKEVDF
jgi:hypothetical protein